jgi:RNA polymerase sigma-70 factor (ECF subfamily)
LTPEARNVLRLSLLEGLGIDAIATIYAVHRATVARWITRSQKDVTEGARRRLGERARLTDAELTSVARACHSQLNLSLVRALSGPEK